MADKPSPPPYMSLGVLKGTLEQLSQSVVPSGPIDRRVLETLSGADYGALMSGLRYLGLVDEERRATPALRSLVQASKNVDLFKPQFLTILKDKYKPIVGELDLAHGTAAQVEKAFRDAGVPQGQMLTKTIRFFVKAMQECGQAISPHITKPKPPTPRQPKKNGNEKSRRREKGEEPEAQQPAADGIPGGFERLPIPGLPGAYLQYPSDLSNAHCTLFEAMIGVLRTYVKNRAGKEGPSE